MENNDLMPKVEIDFTKSQEIEDDLEILKLKNERVHVFKLSAMSSSDGHTTSDFVDLIFKGMMKITIKGDYMIIYFLNQDNTIFVVSLIDENLDRFMIPCKDSSRYFSLRAMDAKGVPGWYGIGKIYLNTSIQKNKRLF